MEIGTIHLEPIMAGPKPHCPDCESVELRRQGRTGFLQTVVLPRLGLFPWECGLCRKIFLLRQRRTRYRKHATEPLVLPLHREHVQRSAPARPGHKTQTRIG